MPRFVARPVVVEAVQYTGGQLPPSFALGIARHRLDGLDIHTEDGLRHCKVSDWVFRDWNGQFWVMSDARFEAMFEEQVEVAFPTERVKRAYTRRVEVDG